MCCWRAAVMLPVVDQAPGPVAGSKTTAVLRVVEPFLPPASKTLPFDKVVTVWPSRALGMLARVLKATCAGSKR